jgi:hypothetical protein
MTSLHRNILSFVILLLPCYVEAQQDSAFQPHTESFQLHYNRFAKDVISQPFLKVRNYSTAQVGYRMETGKFMEAQAPQQENEFSFYTEGTRKIRKILLSGNFGYYNTKTDSQAFTLRQNYKDPIPYFYYAARKGNWQTIRYQLQGIISFPLYKDKLTLGAGATYNSFNAWRSNDPRAEEFLYEVNGTAILHYRFLPKHTFGAGGGYISKNYDNTWEFRNDNLRSNPLYTVYVNNGYGNILPENFMVQGVLSTNTTGYTAEGIYNGEFPFGTFTLKGKYQNTTAVMFKKVTGPNEKREDLGDFNDDIYMLNLNWQKNGRRHHFNIAFDYSDELGKDYNRDLAANNYIYSLQQAKLQGLWSKLGENGKMKYEAGFSVSMEDRLKMDGSVGQKVEYQSLEAGISGAYYFYFPANNSVLKTGLRTGFRNPLHAEAVTVPQRWAFTEGVVYRDYYFFNAQSYSVGANLTYQFPVQKLNFFVRTEANFISAKIPDPVTSLIPTSYPGNNRMQWQCSIGLNL